jgi:hypothetical protein
MLMISVSENFLVESEMFLFWQNKICSFIAQCIYIYVGHSFLWNTIGPTPLWNDVVIIVSTMSCNVSVEDLILSKQKHLWFYQKVLWNWYHQHALVFDWQHICYLWWTCYSTYGRHTYGYKLCSSSRRLVPLFVWGKLHTGASQEKRKEAILIL